MLEVKKAFEELGAINQSIEAKQDADTQAQRHTPAGFLKHLQSQYGLSAAKAEQLQRAIPQGYEATRLAKLDDGTVVMLVQNQSNSQEKGDNFSVKLIQLNPKQSQPSVLPTSKLNVFRSGYEANFGNGIKLDRNPIQHRLIVNGKDYVMNDY